MSVPGLGRVKNALSGKMKRTGFSKTPYFGRAKCIPNCLTLITEKNVLLRKRSFAFLHSQGQKRVLAAVNCDFRSTPINGHRQTGPTGPFRATKTQTCQCIQSGGRLRPILDILIDNDGNEA